MICSFKINFHHTLGLHFDLSLEYPQDFINHCLPMVILIILLTTSFVKAQFMHPHHLIMANLHQVLVTNRILTFFSSLARVIDFHITLISIILFVFASLLLRQAMTSSSFDLIILSICLCSQQVVSVFQSLQAVLAPELEASL